MSLPEKLEDFEKMSDHKRMCIIMEQLEAALTFLPVATLRSYVAKGESMIGKGAPALPSGQPFDKQTRKGRLWLDLIDELERLDEAYR